MEKVNMLAVHCKATGNAPYGERKDTRPAGGCVSYPPCLIYKGLLRRSFILYQFLKKGGEAHGYQRQKTEADRHEGT